MPLAGIDIYQGDDSPTTPLTHVDFLKMRSSGAAFCIIKAGQALRQDALFTAHLAGAHAAGLITGAYYFLDRTASFEAQAAHFVNVVKMAPNTVDLPPFLDFECAVSAAEAGTFRLSLKTAGQMVRDGLGDVGLYTSASKWAQLQTTDAGWVFLFPTLWVARYLLIGGAYYKTFASVASLPTPTIAPWPKAAFWQFTPAADGMAYGLESKGADLNRFDGDMTALKALCIHDEPAPPPALTLESLDKRITRLEQIAGL